MQVLQPAENVLAFYEGREPGLRYAEGPNWVDDGALSLGIASYALVDRDEALVYDTHVSVDRARSIRTTLEQRGVERITVLLSHWHLDHVAGNAAFSDCQILAGRRTAELLAEHRAAIETGSHEGPPAIKPLIEPTRVLDEGETLTVGALEVAPGGFEIHSDDATVVWLPEQRLLLAGDAVEDTLTYLAEPEHLERHLSELDRLDRLRPQRILPSHGSPERIGGGGYSRGLIRATQQYVRALLRIREHPELAETSLRQLIAGPLEAGWIEYFGPYEQVHAENLKLLLRFP